MSDLLSVIPVASSATALHLEKGKTTASELRAFSGRITVGHYESDERSLVYVTVGTVMGVVEAAFGDWLVKDDLGNLSVLDDDAFTTMYAPADDAAYQAFLAARRGFAPGAERVSDLVRSLRSE